MNSDVRRYGTAGASPNTVLAAVLTGVAFLLSIVALVLAGVALQKAGESPPAPMGTVYLDVDFRTMSFDLNTTWTYLETPTSPSSAPLKLETLPRGIDVSMTNPNATDDGIVSQDPVRGLIIDSSEFKQRRPSIFDHPKYLTLTQQSFIPPAGRRISVEATMSMYTTGIINASAAMGDPVLTDGLLKYASGVMNPTDDPRLACAALNMLDLQHGMIYDFIITNMTIFALYEHLPFTTETAVFTYAIPVGKRGADPDVFNTYRIEYDTAKDEVAWYIDGVEVFRVTQPGLPLPNPEYQVFMRGGTKPTFNPVSTTAFNVGFGTFSLLDFLPFWGTYDHDSPDYYVLPDVPGSQPISILSDLPPLFPTDGLPYLRIPNEFGERVPVTVVTHTIDPMSPLPDDGQGAVLTVRDIKVYDME